MEHAVPSASVSVAAIIDKAAPSVSIPVTANTDGVAPSTVPLAANISVVLSEPDNDPDAVDLAEQSEEVMEGNNDDDNRFDVVENITSDAYQL
jgi:hypothetical protein